MKFSTIASGLAAQALSASAGTTLWDGRFNDMKTSADLEKWSWSSQVGPYQYYIHGDSKVSAYVNLSPEFKNPADSGSSQGAKITLDSTAYWHGQNMRRTELIPQTTAAINKGKVFYHFSLMRSDVNPPAETREHQIAFFESHFTELKAGWISGEAGTSDPLLRWDVGGTTHWNVTFDAGVWHNVAYEIDFDAGTVGFWHSTGADDLAQAVAPVTASTSSNGADWHVGVLELPRDGNADTTEDLYWSGVYIESGDLTKPVSGPGGSSSGGAAPSASSAAPVASSAAASAPAPSSSSAAPAPTTSAAAHTATGAAATTLATRTSSSSAAAPTLGSSAATSSAAAAPTTLGSGAATSSAAAATPSARPGCKARRNRVRRPQDLH